MSTNYEVLKNDLKNATVKELTDCIKAVNANVTNHARMVVSGKKDEVISRFTNFIMSLIANNKHQSIAQVVRIVNEVAPRKLFWRYENEEISVNCHRPRQVTREKGTTLQIEQLDFKASPFFKPLTRLTSIKIVPASIGNHRQSKLFQFTLSEEQRQLLATSNANDDRPPYQIRFYCSKFIGSANNLLVEFPSVCELKVNDNVIPGSVLRCLKGKPGTVNPADLTIMTRKQALNSVELVYVNSDTPYIASIYITERTPVNRLIEAMKESRVLPKEQVLEKLQQIQEDADIIMESETLSTKDPLAFTRINTPIRSKSCQHLQCFDASVFLTMNEQTPTWSCPVCYRRIDNWEDLIIDSYFTEMLHNTPKHIDTVRVEPNGHITIIDENPDMANNDDSEAEDELPQDAHIKEEELTILLDDDDDVEVQQETIAEKGPQQVIESPSVPATSQENNNHIPYSDTSSTLKRKNTSIDEQDQNESTPQPQRKKQKSNVIDLTLDSDDEAPLIEIFEEVVNNSNQSSQQSTDINNNEALILPHFGTLYNAGINKNHTNSNNNNTTASASGSFMNVYKYN